jgi:hypothetical protein
MGMHPSGVEGALPNAVGEGPREGLDLRLDPGHIGGVAGPRGVGKSAMLTRLGFEEARRGGTVLHLSGHHGIEYVKRAWDERIREAFALDADPVSARTELLKRRMIEVTTRLVTPEHLSTACELTARATGAPPSLVLLDGGALAEAGFLEACTRLLERHDVALWAALPSEALAPTSSWLETSLHALLELEPRQDRVNVRLLRWRGEGVARDLGILDAQGSLARDPTASLKEAPLLPAECTLVSGGAQGAECAFGECAEAWGLRELHFTFEGHLPVRRRGLRVLSEGEMSAGDVSLLYVSRRLNRSYRDGSHVRKVLQSLWHQVRSAETVFVVGMIQDDDTVMGGTGWAVELARMWNKPLWVYDQAQHGWFYWQGTWVAGQPSIRTRCIAGTGTRHLSDEAREAIRQLFETSFARTRNPWLESSGER